MPDDTHWSLTERKGYLRLHSLPAPNFWMARNTLTQRAVGPQSSATTMLDASGMKENDVAGLALLNRPYAWVGVRRSASGLALQQYDQTVDSTATIPLRATRVWLRADCDFLTEESHFSYSTDGTKWTRFGRVFTTAFQLKTFQGVRFALFHYNTGGAAGRRSRLRLDARRRAAPARSHAADSIRSRDRAVGGRSRYEARGRRPGAFHRRRSRTRTCGAEERNEVSVGRDDVGHHGRGLAARWFARRRRDLSVDGDRCTAT